MRPNRTYMWNMHVEASLLNVVTYSTIYSIKLYKKKTTLTQSQLRSNEVYAVCLRVFLLLIHFHEETLKGK